MRIHSPLPNSDAFSAVMRWAESQHLRDCEKPGTMHTIGDNTFPCVSSGWCLTDVIVEAPNFNMKADPKLLEWFGFPKGYKVIPRPHIIPRKLTPCPCRAKSHQERKETGLKFELGIDKEIDPSFELIGAHEAMRNKKSLFIKSKGYDDPQIVYYLIKNLRKVMLFKNIQFSDYLVKSVKEYSEWKLFGTFAVIGLDKITATEFISRRIQHFVEQAVASKKLRIIITSKLGLTEFAARFANGPDGLELINNLRKMHYLEVR